MVVLRYKDGQGGKEEEERAKDLSGRRGLTTFTWLSISAIIPANHGPAAARKQVKEGETHDHT
jgi:hypothetical protein